MKIKKFLVAIAFSPLLFSCGGGGGIKSGTYTLTLKAVGGTFSSTSSATRIYSDVSTITNASDLETPTKSSYTFTGWYESTNSSANSITFPLTLTSDKTIYAHWQDSSSYSVTIDPNGGTLPNGSTSSYTFSNSSTLKASTLDNYIPTYDGKVFLGWYYDDSSLDNELQFPVTLNGNLTVYARWATEGDTHTVTVNAGSGTFIVDSASTKTLTNQYKIYFDDIETPSRDGYVFSGWYDTAENNATQYGYSLILKNNLEIYAHWYNPSSGDFNVIASDGGSFTKSGSKYTLSKAGTYDVYGSGTEYQLYVNAGESDDVDIVLNGVTMTNSADSSIYVNSANNVKVKAKVDTVNTITDNRASEVSESQGAIYSDCDLKFAGQGKLNVTSNANSAIHCTKDVTIKNLTLMAKAQNNAIKGKDSITMESGSVNAISLKGNALKTSATDLSSSGNQRGNINIYGGTLKVNSYYDGIDAAYNVNIESSEDEESGETLTPSVTVKTGKYADTSGEDVDTDTLYIRSTTQLSSLGSNYKYYVYSYDEDEEDGDFSDAATYVTSKSEGGGWGGSTTYYFYSLTRPTDYDNFKLYICNGTPSTESGGYYAKSSATTYNNSFNMVTMSRISKSSKSISGIGWNNYSESGGGGTSTSSAKGIKAHNNINISDGDVYVKSYDDAIHANAGDTIESGGYGQGNVNIYGGTTTVYSDDDGIHADAVLNISGGINTVTNAYEGVEGAQINFTGGTTTINSTDDGVNASATSSETYHDIKISGSSTVLDVTVTGSDVDGIDSNASYYQTGGIVISRAITNGGPSSGLDCSEGSCSLTGGVLMCLGNSPESYPFSVTKTFSTGLSANTTFTVKNTSSSYCPFTYTNSATVSGKVYLYSKDGGTFTLS